MFPRNGLGGMLIPSMDASQKSLSGLPIAADRIHWRLDGFARHRLHNSRLQMQISGQCHCGAISFTATVDPTKVLVCHCADCQQISGGPFRAVLPVPVENVAVSGKAKHYIKVAASGNRRAQAFCAECGTQLYSTEADDPRVLSLRLGCVNERAQLVPFAQIWGESAMPWLHQLEGVPVHRQGPSSSLMTSSARVAGKPAAS